MIIDLSVKLDEKMPTYPGDPKVEIEPAGVLDKDGFADSLLSFGTHAGTHIDAPFHMLQGGKTLDDFPANKFVGRGKLVNLNSQTSVSDIEGLSLSPDDIVLFKSGFSQHFYEPKYFKDYPVISERVAQFLADNKVKMVGLDTCSVDNQRDFPVHKILLKAEILIIENLTNLDKLVGKAFKVFALPLRLDLDGSPARVVAEVEE